MRVHTGDVVYDFGYHSPWWGNVSLPVADMIIVIEIFLSPRGFISQSMLSLPSELQAGNLLAAKKLFSFCPLISILDPSFARTSLQLSMECDFTLSFS